VHTTTTQDKKNVEVGMVVYNIIVVGTRLRVYKRVSQAPYGNIEKINRLLRSLKLDIRVG
jgi:hypothetical protein